MDYIPYQSGLAGIADCSKPTFIDEEVKFTAYLAAPIEKFYIKFRTAQYRPNHLVTIRTDIDGWDRDIYGAYFNGEWVFFLEKFRYSHDFQMKFVLDGNVWMLESNFLLQPSDEHIFTDQNVTFPPVPSKYLHGYDNLRTEENKLQQDAIPGNTDETIEYDFIIVGSGVGGGILSDELSDKGYRVLVVEAGSLLYPTHITNLPGDWSRLPSHHQVGHFINEEESEFLFGVQMNFGGRSIFWSGLIPTMHDWELDLWPNNVKSYLINTNGYKRAEKIMRKQKTLGKFQENLVKTLSETFTDFFVEDLPVSRHQTNMDDEGNITNIIETSTGTFSTAALLLDSLAFKGSAGRDNLTINLNHLVTEIVTTDNKATAVICQDLIGNKTRRYIGKNIILAAGSLESPRIAMCSHLYDLNHKIGIGLTDHPAFFSNIYELSQSSPFAGIKNHAKILLHHKQANRNEHPYNIELLINPKYWNVAHADDDLWEEKVESDQRTLVRLQFNFSSPLDDRNHIVFYGEGKKLGVKVHRNLSGSHLFNEVRDIRNSILSFLQANFDPNEGMHFGNEGTVHHAGGSMRMSDDHTGVVDENLRIEGFNNLYVCDVSVFPMIPAANPCLTLAALALRLADHLTT